MTYPGPCHSEFTCECWATENFSPSWTEQQSHFGKRASDQINSFMELSGLIKLLYYVFKLINRVYQTILWVSFLPSIFMFTVLEGSWCQSKQMTMLNQWLRNIIQHGVNPAVSMMYDLAREADSPALFSDKKGVFITTACCICISQCVFQTELL